MQAPSPLPMQARATLCSHLLEHAHLCLVHECHADLVIDTGRDIGLNQ